MFLTRSEEYPLDQMIDVAAGRTRADLVLKNANVVNVFTGEVTPGDIAIHGAFIAGIGEYVGNEVIDLFQHLLSLLDLFVPLIICPSRMIFISHITDSILNPAKNVLCTLFDFLGLKLLYKFYAH